MFVAGGAGGDFDDRGWGAGLSPRAPRPPVNRATRSVVVGTGIAGLVATIVAFALTADDGWGNPFVILALAIPLAIGWAFPLRFFATKRPTRCSWTRSIRHRGALAPADGSDGGVPPRYLGGLAPDSGPAHQGGLQPRSDHVVGGRSALAIFVLIDNGPPGDISLSAVLGAIAGAIAMSSISAVRWSVS